MKSLAHKAADLCLIYIYLYIFWPCAHAAQCSIGNQWSFRLRVQSSVGSVGLVQFAPVGFS